MNKKKNKKIKDVTITHSYLFDRMDDRMMMFTFIMRDIHFELLNVGLTEKDSKKIEKSYHTILDIITKYFTYRKAK